jgi:hypothetical protein
VGGGGNGRIKRREESKLGVKRGERGLRGGEDKEGGGRKRG